MGKGRRRGRTRRQKERPHVMSLGDTKPQMEVRRQLSPVSSHVPHNRSSTEELVLEFRCSADTEQIFQDATRD
jgi:hypothetical protein